MTEYENHMPYLIKNNKEIELLLSDFFWGDPDNGVSNIYRYGVLSNQDIEEGDVLLIPENNGGHRRNVIKAVDRRLSKKSVYKYIYNISITDNPYKSPAGLDVIKYKSEVSKINKAAKKLNKLLTKHTNKYSGKYSGEDLLELELYDPRVKELHEEYDSLVSIL